MPTDGLQPALAWIWISTVGLAWLAGVWCTASLRHLPLLRLLVRSRRTIDTQAATIQQLSLEKQCLAQQIRQAQAGVLDWALQASERSAEQEALLWEQARTTDRHGLRQPPPSADGP